MTDSAQKQLLLLKFAKAGDGKLIRIDLDYANAFNSAGHMFMGHPLVMATPHGLLAHERMTRGRGVDAQATYIVFGIKDVL